MVYIFTIYKYGREPRNITWQAACWRPLLQTNLPDQFKNVYIQRKKWGCGQDLTGSGLKVETGFCEDGNEPLGFIQDGK